MTWRYEPPAPTMNTITAAIAEQIHRASGTSAQIDRATQDVIWISICKAMAFLRSRIDWFTQETEEFWLLEAVSEYPRSAVPVPTFDEDAPPAAEDVYHPGDLLAIEDARIRTGSGSSWVPFLPDTIDEVRALTASTNFSYVPTTYCLFGENLIVGPEPSQDCVVKIDYNRDLGVPRYAHDSVNSRFEFYAPFGTRPLGGSDELDGLAYYPELIELKALWFLYTRFLDDNDNAAKMDRLFEDEMKVSSVTNYRRAGGHEQPRRGTLSEEF